MGKYKLETKLFGEIEVSQKEIYNPGDYPIAHYESYELVLNEKEKIVDLHIFNVLTNDNIKTIEDMLNNVPQMYEEGKKAIFNGKDSNELIKYYVYFHIEELDEIHELFDVDSNDKISFEMFVEKLDLRAIAINVDKENGIDCTLDFSLQKEYSDELLVVSFNDKHEIYSITHES